MTCWTHLFDEKKKAIQFCMYFSTRLEKRKVTHLSFHRLASLDIQLSSSRIEPKEIALNAQISKLLRITYFSFSTQGSGTRKYHLRLLEIFIQCFLVFQKIGFESLYTFN